LDRPDLISLADAPADQRGQRKQQEDSGGGDEGGRHRPRAVVTAFPALERRDNGGRGHGVTGQDLPSVEMLTARAPPSLHSSLTRAGGSVGTLLPAWMIAGISGSPWTSRRTTERPPPTPISRPP